MLTSSFNTTLFKNNLSLSFVHQFCCVTATEFTAMFISLWRYCTERWCYDCNVWVCVVHGPGLLFRWGALYTPLAHRRSAAHSSLDLRDVIGPTIDQAARRCSPAVDSIWRRRVGRRHRWSAQRASQSTLDCRRFVPRYDQNDNNHWPRPCWRLLLLAPERTTCLHRVQYIRVTFGLINLVWCGLFPYIYPLLRSTLPDP